MPRQCQDYINSKCLYFLSEWSNSQYVAQFRIIFCKSCFFFCIQQASQPDELTIEEQEVLEVIDDGDMEDWVKVQRTWY